MSVDPHSPIPLIETEPVDVLLGLASCRFCRRLILCQSYGPWAGSETRGRWNPERTERADILDVLGDWAACQGFGMPAGSMHPRHCAADLRPRFAPSEVP